MSETETSTEIRLPNVLLRFSDIFEAKEFKGSTKFRAVINMGPEDGPNAAVIKKLKAIVADCMKEKFPKADLKELVAEMRAGKRFPYMLGKAYNKEKPTSGISDLDFVVKLSANPNFPPLIVGRDKKVITDKRAVYNGCIVNVLTSPYAYNTKGEGLTLNLLGIQLVSQGPSLGGGSGNGINPDTAFDTLEEEVATGKDAGAMFGQGESDDEDPFE